LIDAQVAPVGNHVGVSTVHLIYGYLGSGKTTFAKKLEQETGGIRLSIDEWTIGLTGNSVHLDSVLFDRVWALLGELWPRVALSGTHDIILDFGFWARASRDDARARAARIGADVVLYRVQCPEEIARARCSVRNDQSDIARYEVDATMFNALRAKFEELGPDEPFTTVETA
jgi:predicted kinase